MAEPFAALKGRVMDECRAKAVEKADEIMNDVALKLGYSISAWARNEEFVRVYAPLRAHIITRLTQVYEQMYWGKAEAAAIASIRQDLDAK